MLQCCSKHCADTSYSMFKQMMSHTGKHCSMQLTRQQAPKAWTPCAARNRQPGSRTIFGMAKGFGAVFGKTSIAGKRPLIKPGKISPELPVPAHIRKPPYAEKGVFPPWTPVPSIHDAKGIEKMRAAGKLAAQVLEYACSLAKPGVTTDSIDKAVHEMCIKNNAYPSPLRYGMFPKSLCTSVNEVVCHGIPDDRPLQDGDIVNLDVTVYLDGYHGDTSRMVCVGNVSPEAKKLVEVTKEALDEAIKICAPGVPYNRIGQVINKIADKHKYGIVKDFVGHGIGTSFHADPHIQHARNNDSRPMKVWQTFTIEPMFVQGSTKVDMWKDKWTAVAADGGLSAQWEHTILITPEGHEILTLP